MAPDAMSWMTSYASSLVKASRWPLTPTKAVSAASDSRLLPSTKARFLASEWVWAAVLSTKVG